VAGVGLLHGIDGKEADGINAEMVEAGIGHGLSPAGAAVEIRWSGVNRAQLYH
jgi:hypothetical protein